MDKKDGDYIEGWKWMEMLTSPRPGEGRISSHLALYRMGLYRMGGWKRMDSILVD